MSSDTSNQIAVIGMTGRFPEAKNLTSFWKNLQNGIEAIASFTDQELEEAGVSSAVFNQPDYVRAKGIIENVELFDAAFFNVAPREAAIMDPQHRIFLECAWEALEHAGYDPSTYLGRIGVYAGEAPNSYLLSLLNAGVVQQLDLFQDIIGNDRDFLSTTVSYKLNLRGPSFTVQTACSTSLVAVHLACQGLMNGECDMALTGGASIGIPLKSGYIYKEGRIDSPDGHCRAFDTQAQGTVGGSGVGLVVLKRLDEALADGDTIHAVILGSAINNDGSTKVGYTAPSVSGQAQVIRDALTVAEVEPDTIGYIEAHGTGTLLGDPIEIEALTQAYRTATQARQFCAIGSVKTNIGHLGAAAGVAGLIKTILALENKQIPPSLHFEQPNPKIDFANSPFFVNARLQKWASNGTPRRAGVSSFGIGGTNAHVILEEAPTREISGDSHPWNLLALSAKTPTAIEEATRNLAAHLLEHSDINLADVAYTLQVGRQAFNYRRMLVCRNTEEAIQALEAPASTQVYTFFQEARKRPVVFMFPGQGVQYVNMAQELYQAEPVFREQLDRCAQFLMPHLKLDLRTILWPTAEQLEQADRQLSQTRFSQPALFVIEYAMAQLWISWGVRPQAMIGHSLGEYVAACLAEVFSLEDALSLVAERGRLMQSLPDGAMLSVQLAETEINELIDHKLSLAAVNGPNLCVLSGPSDAVDEVEQRLTGRGIACRRLRVSHAFHSEMMDPIVGPFAARVGQIKLKPPQIPFISNVTGTWITTAEATDPHYWAKHLRQTVRFASGMEELLKEQEAVVLEVGPGRTLSILAEPHKTAGRAIFSSLPHPKSPQSDTEFLLTTLGQLWLSGVHIAWQNMYTHELRQRLPLPTYPFDRQRYWLEVNKPAEDHTLLPEGELASEVAFSLYTRPDLQQEYEAPRTEIERILATIWQEVLGVDRVGIHDDFYALGGNSLMVAQIVSRLKRAFSVELPLRELFQSPTIAQAAEVVERALIEKIDDLSEEEVDRLMKL